MDTDYLKDPRVIIGVFAGLIAAGLFFISPDLVYSTLVNRSHSVVIMILLGLYIVRSFIAIPLSVFAIFIGYRFGTAIGFPLAMIGMTISTVPPYLVGSYVTLDVWIFRRFSRYGEEFFNKTGSIRGMISIRLTPVPSDPVSYSAGVSNVSAPVFLLGTFVGELPWIGAQVLIGSSMVSLTSQPKNPDLRLAILASGVALLLLASPVYRYLTETDMAHST